MQPMEPMQATQPMEPIPTGESPPRRRSRVKAALAGLAIAGMLTGLGAVSVFAASPQPSSSGSPTASDSAGDSGSSGSSTDDNCPDRADDGSDSSSGSSDSSSS